MLIRSLTKEQAEALLYEWRFWARPNQLAPEGNWSTWLALAGRGFGKTETGAQWIRERVKRGARSIALVAETNKDLEEVMVERILRVHPASERPRVTYRPVHMVWPNGAIALGYNGTEPDQLRGPEFDTAWVDELAKYRYAQDLWDMLQFTMRAGTDPRVFVSTTPRPIPVIKSIIKDPATVVTKGSTFDNAKNLPQQFLDKLKKRYAGTRLGRQELEAEILDDVQGALWTRETLDQSRVTALPDMQRVVVAIDPSGTRGEDSNNSVGIIVAGLGIDGLGYILADRSCDASPAVWGRRAVHAYHEFRADKIVAEENFGGAMVEFTIKTVDPQIPYKHVSASRGKVLRAEPVAALYEQGRVKHHGDLHDLEDQMTQITGAGYMGEGSPDRLDAAVWAITELMLGDQHGIGIF